METSGSSEVSDGDYICGEMKKIGYVGFHAIVNAAEHGAITSRIRVYFVFALAKEVKESVQNKAISFAEELL
eukprot:8281617-Pyramimonas_sp.AAC.1